MAGLGLSLRVALGGMHTIIPWAMSLGYWNDSAPWNDTLIWRDS